MRDGHVNSSEGRNQHRWGTVGWAGSLGGGVPTPTHARDSLATRQGPELATTPCQVLATTWCQFQLLGLAGDRGGRLDMPHAQLRIQHDGVTEMARRQLAELRSETDGLC